MDQESADLYGLPLEEFTKARDELARRLKREGDREEADAVKRLRKPSAAAWAVNQASRSQPKDRKALLKAGEDLRRAQEKILGGKGSVRDLEPALERHRDAVDALADAAAGLLSSQGTSPSGPTLERVRETLQAVPTDPELADLVEAGTLDRERRAAGLGFMGAPAAAPAPKPANGSGSGRKSAHGSGSGRKPAKGSGAKGSGAKGSGAKGSGAKGSGAKGAARETVKAARDRAKQARAAEREARRRLQKAERGAGDAVAGVEKAERALDAATGAATKARDRLATAGDEHAAAERAAAEADRALERARSR